MIAAVDHIAEEQKFMGRTNASRERTYIHTYIHTYVHSFIHSFIHSFNHTYMNTFMYIYIHAHFIHDGTHARTKAYMFGFNSQRSMCAAAVEEQESCAERLWHVTPQSCTPVGIVTGSGAPQFFENAASLVFNTPGARSTPLYIKSWCLLRFWLRPSPFSFPFLARADTF